MPTITSRPPRSAATRSAPLFLPLDIKDEWSGERSHSVVFDHDNWVELRDGLRRAADAKGAVVFCGTGWRVKANEHFNIRGYRG